MDEGFVQVEHERELALALLGRRQVGRLDQRQGLVAAEAGAADAVEGREAGELLEDLDFLAGLDDDVARLGHRLCVDVLQRLVYGRVERLQGGPVQQRGLYPS